jgi:hypothetical protein
VNVTSAVGPEPSPNYEDYREAILTDLSLPPEAWRFKSTAGYRHILEHVPLQQAHDFIACVRAEFLWLWDALKYEVVGIAIANDHYGKPLMEQFPELGLVCSPSNFRYLYHALLVLNDIRQHAEPVDIVELGGGYGGLALYIQSLQHHFGNLVRRYVIVDLPEAVALIERYCSMLGLPVIAVNGLDPALLDSYLTTSLRQFFVSCYGFAEFDVATQHWYAERVIRRCDHGFLAWNYADNWSYRPPNHVYQFTEKSITTEPERPLIAPGCLFVRF